MARGAHIYVMRRAGYSHHGIDCGDGSVIHFTGEPGSTKHSACIARSSLEEFLQIAFRDDEALPDQERAARTSRRRILAAAFIAEQGDRAHAERCRGGNMPVLELKERVRQVLTDLLEGPVEVDPDGDFRIRIDSTAVFVRVVDRGEDPTVVQVFSQVLSNVPLGPELYRWVATEGQAYWFGGSKLLEMDGAVGRLDFEYNLLGDYLDAAELRNAVRAVGATAERLDDELQARFGGERLFG